MKLKQTIKIILFKIIQSNRRADHRQNLVLDAADSEYKYVYRLTKMIFLGYN